MKRHQYMITIDEDTDEDSVHCPFEVSVTHNGAGPSTFFYGKSLASTLRRAVEYVCDSEDLEA